MSAVSLAAVTVDFGRGPVLASVGLEIARGEWIALVGANGAGKTTLIRAVAGLAHHTGSIELMGRPSASLTRRERARTVAVVSQQPALPGWMTTAEYVLLGRTPHLGVLEQEGRRDLEIAERVLTRLDLRALADRPLATLSGGERQRAIVARALAQEASIILLDEPTAALDIGHQQQVFELLDGLREESELTLVAAMHDLTLAAQYADRVILLDSGHIVADGSPPEVLTVDNLARHFDAAVRVLTVDGAVAVVPTRSAGSPASRS